MPEDIRYMENMEIERKWRVGALPENLEEYNLPLTEEAFRHMLPKCDGRVIKKKRYVIPLEGTSLKAELDVFDEPFAPLMIIEVEFPTLEEAEAFIAPDWFGEDVTHDRRFKNAVMAIDPAFDPKDMLAG